MWYPKGQVGARARSWREAGPPMEELAGVLGTMREGASLGDLFLRGGADGDHMS